MPDPFSIPAMIARMRRASPVLVATGTPAARRADPPPASAAAFATHVIANPARYPGARERADAWNVLKRTRGQIARPERIAPSPLVAELDAARARCLPRIHRALARRGFPVSESSGGDPRPAGSSC